MSFIVAAAAAALLAASEVAGWRFPLCAHAALSPGQPLSTSRRLQLRLFRATRASNEGKGPAAKPSKGKQPCQSSRADGPSVGLLLYVNNTVRREGRTAMWCSRCSQCSRCSGPWRCVLWLHMLAVATDSCWMDEGCVSGCWLLLRASPATSAIRTPNRKSQVSTPYSAWRRKLPDQRCRLVWLLLLPSLLTVSPPCLRCCSCQSFSTVLRPSAQDVLQPFVSVVCFRVSRLLHVVESVLGDIPVVARMGGQV